MPTESHLKLPRDPAWAALAHQWLRDHPTCAACGSKKNLEVHHKVPVHVSRSLELDPNNLITLCENTGSPTKDPISHCHFIIGHLGNWFNYNRQVDKQAYDHLIAMYPKPLSVTHKAPIFQNAEPAKENPAKAATPQNTEHPPASFHSRQRRR